MRNLKLSRRGFLKMASASSLAMASGLTGIPSPLKASSIGEPSKALKKLLDFKAGTKTKNFCEMCFWNCGVDVYTLDGKIRKLEGNKFNPNNTGNLCAKGNAGIQSTYDPDRVKYPLKRVGKRGEGKWKRISWEEAYKEIHDKLEPIIDEYGPESIGAFAHGTGQPYFRQLTEILGTPNITIPSFSECRGSRAVAFSLTFGGGGIGGYEFFDTSHSKFMLIFGRNIAGALQVREAKDFVEGKTRGAKVVYFDPRQSETAALADKWVQIRPGYDGAIALALIHVIIRDNLANMEFVNKYCYGYNELREHVRKYSPKWAEELTGIKASEIENIAWEYAKCFPHVVAIPPRRISRYGTDTQTARAIAILNALAGNYGQIGGIWVNQKFPLSLPEDEKPPKPEARRADRAGKGEKFHLSPPNLGLTNQIYISTMTEKPYPIKAWIAYASNPIGNSAAAGNKVIESLKKLDFVLAIDTQMSDTAWYADIVLPESTYLERYDKPYFGKGKIPFVTYREPAIKPLYDTKHIFDMCKGICHEFDYDEYFNISPKDQIENLKKALSEDQRKILEEKGVVTYEDVEPFPGSAGLPLHFPTPTGKVQLYSPQLEELYDEFGEEFNPMPVFIKPPEPKKDEFRLLFGMSPVHSHARTQNNWILMQLQGDSPIWINPEDAKALNLKEGDKVIMTGKNTKIVSKPESIKITKRIKKGSVFIYHGFGHISKMWSVGYEKGLNNAFYCSNDIDPISGCSGFNNGFVSLKKA